MLLISLLALASFQDVPADPSVVLTLTVQSLPKSFKQNPVVSLSFNRKGQVSNCNVSKTSGSSAIDRVACTQVAGNFSIDPVDDKAPDARDVVIAFETDPKG